LGDVSTTSKIAKILEILNDAKWHTLEEIQEKTNLNTNQVKQVVKFLKEYNFIAVNEAKKKVKLNQTIRNFLIQTATS